MNREGSVVAYAREKLLKGEDKTYWQAFLDGALAQLQASMDYRKEDAQLLFSDKEIKDMEQMVEDGYGIMEIANKYHTYYKMIRHLFPEVDFTFKKVNPKQCIYDDLRVYLNNRKMCVGRLADLTKYSTDSIRDTLKGSRPPSKRMRSKILEITGIDIGKENDA